MVHNINEKKMAARLQNLKFHSCFTKLVEGLSRNVHIYLELIRFVFSVEMF